MKIGRYSVTVHNHGFFRLDGGAMFGSVPKTLWSRTNPADELNRITLATRSLVIECDGRKMLVDVGCGDKYNAKTREIFAIPDAAYVPVPGVTDVLLTHLHFDHAGGVSRFGDDADTIVPNYANAKHFVSKRNLENARNPHAREKASYLIENVAALQLVEGITIEPGEDIWPGISLNLFHGHTDGLGCVMISDGGETIAFPSDLIPTASHLPIPYVMGYDMCARTAMEEKAGFLQQAAAENWIVVFEHDPEIAAGRIRLDERGRPNLVEADSISAAIQS